jgi:hypothetical protein
VERIRFGNESGTEASEHVRTAKSVFGLLPQILKAIGILIKDGRFPKKGVLCYERRGSIFSLHPGLHARKSWRFEGKDILILFPGKK